MKKVLLLVFASLSFIPHVGGIAEASDNKISVVFGPTAPCATACSYWQTASTLGFQPCENPFPAQSYFDVVSIPAPTPPSGKQTILILETHPMLDSDTWICDLLVNGSHNGGELAQGSNVPGQLCPWAPAGVPLGCTERAQTAVEAGKRVVLRAYNWADIPYLNGRYWFEFV